MDKATLKEELGKMIPDGDSAKRLLQVLDRVRNPEEWGTLVHKSIRRRQGTADPKIYVFAVGGKLRASVEYISDGCKALEDEIEFTVDELAAWLIDANLPPRQILHPAEIARAYQAFVEENGGDHPCWFAATRENKPVAYRTEAEARGAGPTHAICSPEEAVEMTQAWVGNRLLKSRLLENWRNEGNAHFHKKKDGPWQCGNTKPVAKAEYVFNVPESALPMLVADLEEVLRRMGEEKARHLHMLGARQVFGGLTHSAGRDRLKWKWWVKAVTPETARAECCGDPMFQVQGGSLAACESEAGVKELLDTVRRQVESFRQG